jgi:hypothetical protein
LSGTARLPNGQRVCRIVIKDESGELGRVVHLEPFEIEQDDGTRVTIELGAETMLLPIERKQGRWGGFADDPLLASFLEEAPGPHVEVVVERAVIADGGRVFVRGEEREHAFDDPKGTRSAPQRRVTRALASAIATGPDAVQMIERALAPAAPKASRNAGVPEGLASRPIGDIVTPARVSLLFAAVLALGSRAAPVTPWKLDLEVAAITLVAIAMWFAYIARVPYFTTHGAKLEDHHPKSFRNLVLLSGFCVLFVSGMFWGFDLKYAAEHAPDKPENASHIVIGIFIAYLALLGGLLARWTRKTAAIVRALASAKTLPAGAPEDTWGGVLGTVRDPTPTGFGGEETAVEHVVQRKVQSGSDPDIITESIVNADTFFVDTDDGRTYEIVPWDATWASSVRSVDVDLPTEERYRYVVVVGGRVWVVGRADRVGKDAPPRFDAAGPESLLFYATPSTVDPRSRIRKLALLRLATFTFMLLCAGAMIARAMQLAPHLPPFHYEGGEGSM